nr:NADPH-dependent FMN reductase [Obelidium mucronatum]
MTTKPFRLPPHLAASAWTAHVDLAGARQLGASANIAASPPRVLVSYSRLLAYEYARLLEALGCDVAVFDPRGLPLKDDASEDHAKVRELRELSLWSHGHVRMIDWIPLAVGSVRPTQGRVLAVSQVNGGSQSFNAVNALRILGRWMRMVTIPNQSSIPKAWTEFDMVPDAKDPLGLPIGFLKPSSYRDRVVDVAEEFFKFVVLLRDHSDFLVDRYSEREEKKANEGKLLSQAEKEEAKKKQEMIDQVVNK